MSQRATFRDGKTTVDFVLVYKVSDLITERAEYKHKTYLETLQTLGLQLETEPFSVDEDVIFVKIHASDEFVFTHAGLFDIELTCQSFEYRPYVKPPASFFATPLTNPNINDPIYARAPETMSGEIPKSITTAERIMVVNQILLRCVWGDGRGDYGIKKLIRHKVFIDAFPLHDGQYEWTVSGPLNDRQLLALYWGSVSCWTKTQPLNLVDKYFGTEYALYFAWLGMYIKHLIPAAILSVVVVLYGLITMFTTLNAEARRICRSTAVMCPICHFSKCPMEMLSNSCHFVRVTYLFDNWCAVVFSAIMSLWATVFMECWQREEAVLQLQWNVRSLERTVSLRPEFLEKTRKRQYSYITGRMEPYMSKREGCTRYTVTLASLTVLVMRKWYETIPLLIVVAVTFGVMVYRVTVNIALLRMSNTIIVINKHKGLIASISGSLMSGIFIFVFKLFYQKIAFALTDMENHRTQHAYNNAYIYKSYALAFANNYAAVFYIAFFKGKFFTYPGDLTIGDKFGGINTDLCDPTGCIVDLSILLIIIMVLKAIFSNITQVLIPTLKFRFNKTLCQLKDRSAPQWEHEYLMAKAEEYFMLDEYMDMVIQYGFVNFFIMGFPLAPLFALLNNLVELRVDALKVTRSYRRPIPTRVSGLGAWFGILQATTYIGAVTNALVIAFTSSFMEKIIWSKNLTYMNESLYIDHILSEFAMEDFQWLDPIQVSNVSIPRKCYYQGTRYPPDHPQKYQRRKDYWQNLAIKFICVVIFEHLVIILKGFIAYAIPDIPFSVKQQVVQQEEETQRKRVLEISQDYLKQREISKREVEKERMKKKQS